MLFLYFPNRFFEAEEVAFRLKNVVETFDKVGPEKIIKNCNEQSPPRVEQEASPAERELVEAIKMQKQEQLSAICAKLTSMKCVAVSSPERARIGMKRRGSEEKPSENLEDEEDVGTAPATKKRKGTPLEPHAKERRKAQRTAKKCCARGCKNECFWSKKWESCPLCNKNFCPSHLDKVKHHLCHPISLHC